MQARIAYQCVVSCVRIALCCAGVFLCPHLGIICPKTTSPGCQSPPVLDSVRPPTPKYGMEEIQITTINLKDFYACYTEATYIEVSNEVTDKLYSAACQRRTKKTPTREFRRHLSLQRSSHRLQEKGKKMIGVSFKGLIKPSKINGLQAARFI